MSRYIYGGTPGTIGRHGYVATGDILELTADEVTAIAADTDFFPVPSRTIEILRVTADTTLTNDDSGSQIRCNNSAAIKLTLPASPTIGDTFEVVKGDACADAVTIDPGDNPLAGAATDHKVASVGSITAGTGYVAIPTADFSAGNGTGATASVRMLALTAATAAPGTGYDVGDTITLAAGTKVTAAVATVASIQAVSASNPAAGSGYTANDVLTLVGGTHSVAITLTVLTVDGGGAITSFSIAAAGTYTVKAGAASGVTGGSGTGATFTITWGVKTATVTTAGNYSVLPPIPATQASTSGAGTGATLTMTWGVSSVTVTAGGDGYDAGPWSVTFTGGSGSGAGGTAATTAISANLTVTDDSIGVYWDGATWKTY